MKTAVVHARMEPQTKEKAEAVLSRLGITPTEAIRVFYRQIALRGGLPFSVTIPNERTAATLRKVADLMSTYEAAKVGDLWLLGLGEHCAVEYYPIVMPQVATWLVEQFNKK